MSQSCIRCHCKCQLIPSLCIFPHLFRSTLSTCTLFFTYALKLAASDVFLSSVLLTQSFPYPAYISRLNSPHPFILAVFLIGFIVLTSLGCSLWMKSALPYTFRPQSSLSPFPILCLYFLQQRDSILPHPFEILLQSFCIPSCPPSFLLHSSTYHPLLLACCPPTPPSDHSFNCCTFSSVSFPSLSPSSLSYFLPPSSSAASLHLYSVQFSYGGDVLSVMASDGAATR